MDPQPLSIDTPADAAEAVGLARGWPEQDIDDLVDALDGVSWDDPEDLADAVALLRRDPDLSALPGSEKLAFLYEQAATMDQETLFDFVAGFAEGVTRDLADAAKAAERAATRPAWWLLAGGAAALLLLAKR